MFGEIIEEAQDFFEDIFEHFFERDEEKKKKGQSLVERTKHAYHFTERVDSFMKVVFGFSIFVSAVIASVWGFASVSGMVESFISSWFGRIILMFIGTSYIVNGYWRFFHAKK